MNDTIAAISSSGGPIGLIRVSGERAIEAINAVFQAKNGKPLTEAPSQKLVYGTLTDKSGNVIDCCYAVALHAPHTYTGETMAELQCHGSPAVLAMALESLFAQGVRQAGPGEFTKRAFLNGKLDLTQAEAVADLLEAETPAAARQAAGPLRGEGTLLVVDEVLNLPVVVQVDGDAAAQVGHDDGDVLVVPAVLPGVAQGRGAGVQVVAHALAAHGGQAGELVNGQQPVHVTLS